MVERATESVLEGEGQDTARQDPEFNIKGAGTNKFNTIGGSIKGGGAKGVDDTTRFFPCHEVPSINQRSLFDYFQKEDHESHSRHTSSTPSQYTRSTPSPLSSPTMMMPSRPVDDDISKQTLPTPPIP